MHWYGEVDAAFVWLIDGKESANRKAIFLLIAKCGDLIPTIHFRLEASPITVIWHAIYNMVPPRGGCLCCARFLAKFPPSACFLGGRALEQATMRIPMPTPEIDFPAHFLQIQPPEAVSLLQFPLLGGSEGYYPSQTRHSHVELLAALRIRPIAWGRTTSQPFFFIDIRWVTRLLGCKLNFHSLIAHSAASRNQCRTSVLDPAAPLREYNLPAEHWPLDEPAAAKEGPLPCWVQFSQSIVPRLGPDVGG
uniref:Uncharacterized protein n=1 Tax=Trichuris muris TaxID=70415 RepID=A0A5S6QSJ3_TRIMR